MQQIKKKQFAVVQSNGDFICIETHSGAIAHAADPLGQTHVLESDASEEAIGLALLDCLSCSRFLPYEENKSFFDDQEARRLQQEQWVKGLMGKYRYKSRRALFSGMDLCTVEKYNGKIHILPYCHVRSEVWVRRETDGFEDVVIPVTGLPDEIGKAAQLAISRCTTE